jgi:IQ and ubiquitin-like domain-containing protein
MLAVIERERMKIRDGRRKQREMHLLEESCSPLKWKSQGGITISMETLKSQRASKLKQLHDKLFTGDINTKTLKQNFIHVQESVKAMEEPKKQETLSLIERELQLLEMGFEFKDVKNLHKRLEKVFANLICDPAECKPARSKFYLCKQCRKMLPPKSFVIPLTRPEMKLCVSCHWIDNMSHERVDHRPFEQMLKELQQYESRRGCYRSMAFVLEVQDIKHLVDHVWHGQSAISQSTNLHELRLGRWDSTMEWSPWNTVLLSKKELTEHLAIADLKAVYGEVFINNVHIKNLIAQIHFKGLRKLK